MTVMGFGIDYTTKKRLIEPIDEKEFFQRIIDSFPHETFEGFTRTRRSGSVFKAEVERTHFPDLSNPLAVGWKYLVSDSDPRKDEIIEAVEPLAKHRGMANPGDPMIYDCKFEHEWWEWIRNNCWPLALDEAPYYIMIIGGPDQVPFLFQALIDSTAAVGRIHFDSIDDLEEYVKKVIRLEKAADPVVSREVVMFAPDGGITDPTFFSRMYMAQPLSEHVKDKLNFSTKRILEDDATKKSLTDALDNSNPALVYTASHGLGAPKERLEIQKKYNGAVCCQDMHTLENLTIPEFTYSADDVPLDGTYLEGSAFFEFSCFGYGTPKRSDFEHWLGDPKLNADEDFVSALPKKLLAHPKGPIGFFGHVDMAFLEGFADPNNPYILKRWHSRVAPFKKAVEEILKAQSLGMILSTMNERYEIGSIMLTNVIDGIRSGHLKMTPEEQARLVEYWITRSDAQNYMLFGDPGTYVRIPA